MATWIESASLTGAKSIPGDWFGAVLALDGSRVLISAMSSQASAGSAYVFELQGQSWVEAATLAASDAAIADFFGYSVDLRGDRAVVGANLKDQFQAGVAQGAAYVFERTGSTWNEVGNLTATGGKGVRIGSAVSIDADRVLVGAPSVPYTVVHVKSGKSYTEGRGPGAAHVFEPSGGTWSQIATLKPADAATGDHFGHAVDVDGDRALIGAPGTGAAYVFERAGAKWKQRARLTPSDAKPSDGFGTAVALDGNRVLVGSRKAAAAYVYEVSGKSWKQTARLTPQTPPAGKPIGMAVALDDVRALVTYVYEDAAKLQVRQVCLFQRIGTAWIQAQVLTPSSMAPGLVFGLGVAIDGDRALVGAPVDPGFSATGTAHVFEPQCVTSAFSLPATQADTYEPNSTFATATAVKLTSAKRQVKLGDLTLPVANDLDYFRIDFKGALANECPSGGVARRYGIGGPFYVDYQPGSLTIDVREEKCRALDLEFYDSKHKLKRKERTDAPVVFRCPKSLFPAASLYVRVASPGKSPVRYQFEARLDPSVARIGGKLLYEPPLLKRLFPGFDVGDPLVYFDMRRLLEDLEATLSQPDVYADDVELAQACVTVADIARDSGASPVARRLYRRVLALLPDASHHDLQARALENLGRISRSLGKKRKAKKYLKRAARARRQGAAAAFASGALDFALAQLNGGEARRAMELLERTLPQQVGAADVPGQVRNHLLQTRALAARGKRGKAAEHLAAARDLLGDHRDVALERDLEELARDLNP